MPPGQAGPYIFIVARRGFLTGGIAAILLLSCISVLAQAQSARVCVPGGNATAVQACNTLMANFNVAGTCIQGASDADCTAKVASSAADVAQAAGNELFLSYENHGLTPVIAEEYGGDAGVTMASYLAVAVVKKSFCDANPSVTFASLRDKNSCHTGFRKNAGWVLPVGYLTSSQVAPVVSSNAGVADDAETVASFFNNVCAPGTTTDGPANNGQSWSPLCSGCQDGCTSTSKYADYAGALRCLIENAGDVAFVKHTTALEYAQDGTKNASWSTVPKDELRLLCPIGGCAPVDNYASCFIARAAAHALVARPGWDSTTAGSSFVTTLLGAAQQSQIQLFSAGRAIAGDFLLTASAQALSRVTSDFKTFFGPNAYEAYKSMRSLSTSAKLCMPSASAPLATCNSYLSTYNIPGTCVARASATACLQAVEDGDADLVMVGGDQLFDSYESYGLEPVVAENYGEGAGVTYRGVAVVKASFCQSGTPTFASLRGKNSCHTGYRKTAGWVLPLGYLVGNNIADVISGDAMVQNDAETLASFFNNSCAPKPTPEGPMVGGLTWAPLCSGCKGDCSGADPYYDYAGALRCMMEGGDVAFVKHTTALEYASDGTAPLAGALRKDQMRLLCPTGGCAAVTDSATCNLGQAAAHALVARPGWKSTLQGSAFITNLLNVASGANAAGFIQAGRALGGVTDFLFSASTVDIDRVDSDFKTYFGASAYEGFRDVRNLERSATVCVPGGGARAVEVCNSLMRTYSISGQCIAGINDRDCVGKVASGAADIAQAAGNELFLANEVHELDAVVAEDYNTGTTPTLATYFGVAVVKRAFCEATPSPTYATLAGKNSCHTGFRKNAGWTIPVGYLTSTRIAPVVSSNASVADDAETVASFFNNVCAPGTTADGPVDGGLSWSQLCNGCGGDCTTASKYADYSGALRCLIDGAGDVAFVKHTTALEYALDGTIPIASWTTNVPKSELRLLCPTGGCVTVDNYAGCFIARAAAHALVARPGWESTGTGDNFIGSLLQAAQQSGAQFINAARNISGDFLVSASTRSVNRVTSDFKTFFGPNAYEAYRSIQSLTTKARLCMPSASAPITTCNSYLSTYNIPGTCVARASATACLQAVEDGDADLVMVGGDQLFDSYESYGLEPVVAENYGEGAGVTYRGVAVVKASFCQSGTPTFASLRGKNSCHTGYRKTAGWVLPLGYLVGNNIADVISGDAMVQNDAETLASFFNNSCAPKPTPEGPMVGGLTWAPLCSGCKGDCSGADPYYDYAGALRCMMEGGDVAFVKHTTALEYASDGTAPLAGALRKDQMRLLCPTGGCAAVTDSATCNLGQAAAHALVARPGWKSTLQGSAFITNLLNVASGANAAGFIQAGRALGGVTDFLFSASTVDIDRVDSDFKTYFGASAYEGFRDVRNLERSATVCVPGGGARAVEVCNSLMRTYSISGQCIAGINDRDCVGKVASGAADIAQAAGNELFLANEVHELDAVVAEDYNTGTTPTLATYFGVAVVKRAFCEATPNPTYATLAGKNSCHTGFRKNAGWTIPVGYLTSTRIAPVVSSNASVADDAETVASFFNNVCAPGTTADGPVDGGLSWGQLCNGCGGDCTTASKYADYSGALRCLIDGAGDVAFVKHTTALEYAQDGTIPIASWTTNVPKSELRLLCPTGGCVTVDNYAGCFIARAAAHALVARPGWESTGTGDNFIGSLLQAAQQSGAQFINAARNISGDFLVSASTRSVNRVTSDFKTFFGPNAYEAYRSIQSLTTKARLCMPSASAPITTCNSYLSTYNIPGTCVARASATACLQAVEDGDADLVMVGGDQLFDSYESYGLEPVVAENYGEGAGVTYRGVAVVKASFCQSGTPTFASLRGKNSCHTGYRKTAGWVLPLGYLVGNNIADVISGDAMVQNDAETLASFFNNSCAPKPTPEGPMVGGLTWAPLCSGCKGDCSGADPYYDYAGALRCMMEGGDVAFVKHTTALEYASDGTAPLAGALRKDQMRLLCPTGGCAAVTDSATCNLGQAAAHALVARPGWKSTLQGSAFITNLLNVASGANAAGFIQAGRALGGVTDFLFSASTVDIDRVDSDFKTYFGASAYEGFRDVRNLERSATVCVPGGGARAVEVCNSLMRTYSISGQCIAGINDRDCVGKVASGAADIAQAAGNELFLANEVHELDAVVAEDYNTGTTPTLATYFGVAVVKRAFCEATPNPTYATLAGKNSCHTGFRKNAGWTIPVGYLTSTRIAPVVSSNASVADDAETVASFFNNVCAPGTTADGPVDGGLSWSQLCNGCGVREPHHGSWGPFLFRDMWVNFLVAADARSFVLMALEGFFDLTTNGLSDRLLWLSLLGLLSAGRLHHASKYADYSGALRCLIDGAGDVAFVKHTTALEYAQDGTIPIASWTTNVPKSELRLLCPTGGCVTVDNYAGCFIARAAAHALVARPGWESTGTGDNFIGSLLQAAQQSGAQFINAARNISGDFLVSASTRSVNRVTSDFKTFFGPNAYEAYRSIQSLTTKARLCMPSASAPITTCNSYLSTYNIPGTCVARASATACLQAVEDGDADLVMVGGDQLFDSYESYGLEPVVAENYGEGAGVTYRGVAVVKASFCQSGTPTFASLRGKNSCHTGYRKTAGWVLPLGYLVGNNIADVISGDAMVQNDAETLASFFNNSCAPKPTPEGPMVGGLTWVPLCSGCKGDCSGADPYYDYAGALRCMMEGGDVAFVKHTTALEYASDGTAPLAGALRKDQMRLLCPTGGCAAVTDSATCNLGQAAAHALVARPGWKSTLQGSAFITNLLNVASGANAAGFIQAGRALGGVTDFLFSASTVDIDRVDSDFKTYFGASAYEGFRDVRNLERSATVCVPGGGARAVEVCNSLMRTYSISGQCIAGINDRDCVGKVASGAADVAQAAGNELFLSHETHDLEPVVAEDYGLGSGAALSSYLSVAVVKRSFCEANPNPTFATLANKNSCHTGFRKNAGWVLPVGYMVSSGRAPVVSNDATIQDDAETVASFFNNVCAPGTTADGPANNGQPWSQLCNGCGGDCTTASKYADYSGALRCLIDGAGDVAFVKHTTALEYAQDGTIPIASWTTNVPKSELRLLCPTGGCVTVDNYAGCFIARAAAHALVARPGWESTGTGDNFIGSLLQAAQQSGAQFINAARNITGDFLVSASTKSIQRVNTDFVSYFGPYAYEAYRSITALSTKARLCVPGGGAAAEASCNAFLAAYNVPGQCVQQASSLACLQAIDDGLADLAMVGGDQLFDSYESYGLEPVVAENYGEGAGVTYRGVAVVKASFCQSGTPTFASLRGKSSCHTGYRKTAGWVLPLGYLLSNDIADVVSSNSSIRNDAETMAAFFGRSCAPKPTAEGPVVGGLAWGELCSGCNGDCSSADPYYDYAGALRCMMEGGDVAFVKHTTPLEYASDGTTPIPGALSKDQMRLLCPTGGCAAVTDSATCNIGQAAAHALVARPGWKSTLQGAAFITNLLNAASISGMGFINAGRALGGVADFLFSASTRDIDRVDSDFKTYFGASAYEGFRDVRNLEVAANVCVPGGNASALANCNALMQTYDISGKCIQGASDRDCVGKVARGEADVAQAAGNELFLAYENHGLDAVVAEDYGIGAGPTLSTYFGVAVVKRSFCAANLNASFATLQGKNSCHTGFRKNAGWTLPVGYLVSNKIASVVSNNGGVEDDAETVASFFNNVCAPGTTAEGPAVGGLSWDQLCNGCGGDCTTASKYADYSGALRCLIDGAGDVAFVKHTTALEYAQDGTIPITSWTTNVPKSELRLLCPTGGCVTVDNYAGCFIARAAAHALVARPGWESTGTGDNFINSLLGAAQRSGSQFINAGRGIAGDFIVSASTKSLHRVNSDFTTFFGPNAYEAYKSIYGLSVKGRVCVPGGGATALSQCSSFMSRFNVPASCVLQASQPECLEAVADGLADVTMVGGDNLFNSYEIHKLEPVLAENYGQGVGVSYRAVAVVKQSFCQAMGNNVTFASLKGKNSCHTGYRKTAGWVLPLGYLVGNGIADIISTDASIQNDAETFAAFFGNSCAPKPTLDGPRVGGLTWGELCTGCNQGDCSDTDPFYDYAGALRCMMRGSGDVAFVKHTTALEYTLDGTTPIPGALPKSQLRLLCPTGGCAAVTDHERCNIGRAASHALVARPGWRSTLQGSALINGLLVANIQNGNSFISAGRALGGVTDFLFSASTMSIDRVDTDFISFFGASAYEGFKDVRSLEPGVRICIPGASAAEKVTCDGILSSFDIAGECVLGTNEYDCLDKIAVGTADTVRLGGDQLFSAAEDYGLDAIAAEDYGEPHGVSYYGVAVVHKSFCEAGVTRPFEKLKGKKACSTGYRKTAGWVLPVGYLVSTGLAQVVNNDDTVQNDAETAGRYFGSMCAPGVTDEGPKDGGLPWSTLCSGCRGNCTTRDPYADYPGALRCLFEGGDVAFVKHSTPLDYSSEGAMSFPGAWSKSDMRLLCPSGGCASVDNYQSCYIARAAAHAFVTRPSWRYSQSGREFLASLMAIMGSARKDSFISQGTALGKPKNLLFSTGTREVRPIETNFRTFFGSNAYQSFLAMRNMVAAPRPAPAKLCMPRASGAAFLAQCNTYLSSAGVNGECMVAPTEYDCMRMVKNGTADAVWVGGDELFLANEEHQLMPVAAEDYGIGAGLTYYGVAVVKKEFCQLRNGRPTFEDLRGKDSCHTGYRKTAGFTLPVGYLVGNRLATPRNSNPFIQNDAETAAGFFGRMCVPRVTSDGPRTGGQSWDELCTKCKGDCSERDPYYDYSGAMRCLMEGAGEVAFVKHTSPLEYASDGTAPLAGALRKEDMRLLCPTGGCVELDNFGSCFIGRAAAHALMARPGWKATSIGSAFLSSLESAAQSSSFIQAGISLGVSAGNMPFFSSSTKGMQLVDVATFADYFGGNALLAFRTMRALNNMTAPTSLTRMCVTGGAQEVADCSAFMDQFDIPATCVSESPTQDCLEKVVAGAADIHMAGGDELFTSYETHKLEPIMAEDYGVASGVSYYSVAVVKKTYCDAFAGNPTLRSLKGKNSCHTGYRKTAGFVLPIGYLVSSGIAPIVSNDPNVQNDAETAADFFGDVCMPRVTDDGPRNGGLPWDALCESCAGDCSESDPYYDYAGALRCLMDDSGDVAFVKHTTPLEYAQDGSRPFASWANNVRKEDLRLLCPSGGCARVDDFAQCYIARAAAHALVARPGWKATADGTAFMNAVMASRGPSFVNSGIQLGLFEPSTTDVQPVTTDFISFFGPNAYAAFKSMRAMDVIVSRVCTASDAEQTFCQQKFASPANAKNYPVQFQCVRAASNAECLRAIAEGRADWRTFDGGDLYKGDREYGLKVAAAENYGIQGATGDNLEYYAVAVVNKEFCDASDASFSKLKGLRSCHTGYRRTAGWTMPLGYLLASGVMPTVQKNVMVSDDAESAAAFFSQTCAPGVTSDGPRRQFSGVGDLWDELCGACKGDCKGSRESEPYFDYPGAFQCLMEEAGDVAFVKHSTVLEYAEDGSQPAFWATKNVDEFRLLCPGQGGCKRVAEYATCNIASVPSHAVLVRQNYNYTTQLQNTLKLLSQDPAFHASIFDSAVNPNNYIFKSGTHSLDPVDESTRAFIGEQAYANYEAMTIEPVLIVEKNTRMKTGAIVGIAVSVGVVAIAIVIGFTRAYTAKKTESKYNFNAKENAITAFPGV
eukprot:jgi/Mesvir1/23266/Mv12880-RA.1